MSDIDERRRPEPAEGGRGLHELSEDTTGFGQLELRTIWHLLKQPGAVLEAYMTQGATGGGLYARPLRLYLGLCGILMLVLFLMGGSDTMLLAGIPEETLQPMLKMAGKSRDAFMADADNWMTLIMVPVMSGFYALFAAPLLRWWDPDDLGWRRGFRATFAYLNAWTVPLMPVAWMGYSSALALPALAIFFLASVVAFWRMGKGRWWRTPGIGLVKALVMSLVLQLAGVIALWPVIAIGVVGGLVSP